MRNPNGTNDGSKSGHVGILGIEVYTPRIYLRQPDLEKHMGVASGKYTIGLGQEGLAFTGDAEDVNSMCLTVVHSLLEKYGIEPSEVGRLEVGTETLVDKSKSTKTVLMSLFPGNTDIEGATVVNACYGGTSALINAFLWCDSKTWDGRYAIVVAGDIATYAPGPARPTCGAGAVAVLVGRDAPLCFDFETRATHSAHVWDFFKPDPSVEHPIVYGALSQTCYYKALEDVYQRFAAKMERVNGKRFDCESPDYFVFHAPYNKLVNKSYARLYLLDARRSNVTVWDEKKESSDSENERIEPESPLQAWLQVPIEATYNDKDLEKILKKLSSECFAKRLGDANEASRQVGNTYAASVFMGLASLVDRVGGRGDLTAGKNVVVFSYGSGALATMYRLQVRDPAAGSRFTIKKMASALDLTNRLASREEVRACELDLALNTRARMHHIGAPYTPVYPTIGRLFPGTYYLNGLDDQWRRTYTRLPLDANVLEPGEWYAPESVRTPTRTTTWTNKTRIECVITGTAAGLPGGGDVFREDNLDRLLAGEQLIKPLPEHLKKAMLEKNMVQTQKTADGIKRVPLNEESSMIQLAAQIGSLDIVNSYGVPPPLAKTMDMAVQLAVAAGLEALKNAGLVRGQSNHPDEWKIQDAYRDSTGVVYASSFPAMDAAVAEVVRFLHPKTASGANAMRLISSLRDKMVAASPDQKLPDEDEAAFARLIAQTQNQAPANDNVYEFDRKFLFRVLVLANAQLAQLAGCRGPNTQINAACAGTTQAVAIAQDMISAGRAERVVVVAGDNASGECLMPWLGSGFRVLGASTIESDVEKACCPFDKRRSGMILGAGCTGVVIETSESAMKRLKVNTGLSFQIKARLLATHYSNSAYHGAALDRRHIASELDSFLGDVHDNFGISKAEIAERGVYFSHETSTHASDASSCSGNEIAALREVFGDDLLKLSICNTKGFTGHPMGVSFEDVAAVEVLFRQAIPPIVNHKVKDDYLGDLNLSKGGQYKCHYSLRFAAGFGSQVAFALYAMAE